MFLEAFSLTICALFRADFWEGDATKHFSVKKRVFSEKEGGNSVKQGFGKEFHRKSNSVKRFGPFTELPDSENGKVAVLIPFPKIRSYCLLTVELLCFQWESVSKKHLNGL